MRRIIPFLVFLFTYFNVFSQSGTEFWFAPPDVTFSHNSPGGVPIYLNMSTLASAATVTVDQPANPGFTPIVINIPANSSHQEDLSAYVADLETAPTNTVLSTGLRVVSDEIIMAYYEVSNTNNADIFALKGANSLGTEFYIPLHNHAPFYNHNTYSSPNLAYASFDIVATEDNTVVLIYSPTEVDGNPALTPFSVTLNQGETYSCAWTGTDYHLPSNHPSGAVVLADKNIAITIKDDSNHNPSGGCYDLLGDQIVPVNIVGTEYIAVKGQLNNNGDESVFILATENNTQVFIDGNATPVTTLFAGQTYRYDMDYLASSADNSVYIETSKPSYVTHVTGFGCEEGQAILPPLGCAGSEQISFSRSTAEGFYLNILVRAAAVNDFTMTGPGTGVIDPTDFITVPGTGGVWMAAQIPYNTTEIPVNQAVLISNSTDVFSLALINGGASSGCRYGFFSEFAAEIIIDAGLDATVCANDTIQLSGNVEGGTTTGQWTSSGSGQFLPNDLDLNAEYVPSPADIAAGNVSITLTSTGNCTPVSDNMNLSITPAPTINAGTDLSVCENNADVLLSGSVTIASGGIWSGGAGTYSPNNTSLSTTYTPSAAEIAAGSVTLNLTSTGNGICNQEIDDVLISFTPAPTVDAGVDQTVCGNNPDVILGGSITVASGGVWSGGAGTFSPNVNALNATYSPTAAEVSSGSVALTLTTNGNGTCNAESDVVTITYTTIPTADAGSDQVLCGNNANATLNGSVTVASGGTWSGGAGTYSPNANTLNAVYTPSAAEITAGSVILTLTTTGNGTCLAVTDNVSLTFTTSPTSDAGSDQTVCANNSDVTLNGAVTISTGGVWSGGTGSFNPNANTLNAVYTPSAAEMTAGSVVLTLTTTGNGTCSPETDDITITITPEPTVNAGTDLISCSNNPDVLLGGSVTIATGGIWSGGSGTFSPNVNALNATYSPSAAEVTSGSVNLTLTTIGNGNCSAISDDVLVSFSNAPTANAGSDQVLCGNNADVTLAGSVTIATGGAWTGGAGTYSPNANSLNAVYTPSAAEILAGSVTLTLTTTGNGTCIPVSDDVILTFTNAPTSNAGADQTVCANNSDVTLNGSVTVATGGVWSGGSGVFTPNANTLNALYTPSASEITAGSVTLTLTTTGNGICNSESDDVTITITSSPIVNAGTDQSVCANNSDVNLAGSITVSSGGVWSGGSGSFSPSNTALNAIYTPSASEILAGSVTLTLTSTGNGLCNQESDNITISITDAPIVNAGVDQVLCANNSDVPLNGSITGATGGVWTGGLGVFTPNNTSLNAVYTPSVVELASGSITLTLTSTGNGSCNSVADDVQVTFTTSPSANAGTDQSVCANNPDVNLAGTVSIATGGVWTGGAGVFIPNATDLNAVYTPTSAEIANGSVTLTLQTTGNGNCLSVSDDIIITIDPEPTVNAGPNLTSCANNSNVNLAGIVNLAAGGIWSGGNGSFNASNTDLNAIYTPSPAEIIAGSVTLTLTSTGNGSCSSSNDDVVISIVASPNADAGLDQTLCANNSDVSLVGSVIGASGGQWTGGLGTFSPSNNSLNAVYTPTAGEIASGNITLTLTTTGNGFCNPESDDVTITFTAAPTSDAGIDLTTCENNPSATLNGIITISSGGIWNGSGTFVPSNTDLNAVYTPTSAEILAGVANLTLTTTGNGSCNPEVDDITISIDPVPIVNAGIDQIVCVNNLNVLLSGSVSGITNSGEWSTSGSGFFIPNNTTLNATYVASAADSAAGSVNLTLTSTNNGNCLAIEDDMLVTILPAGVADAGNDIIVCANNASVLLSGIVSGGATTGNWTSNGTGVFVPNDSTLNATYIPSAADAASGIVTLTLTANSCDQDSDEVIVTITPEPIANAGADQTVCASNLNISLVGSVTGASTTGVWTTSGSGSFIPNANDLNATYVASSADSVAQTVSIFLEATGIGTCVPVVDTVIINIFPTGIVDAGADQNLCSNNSDVQLSGNISGGASLGQWSSSGSGVFVPNANDLNAIYIPSPTDLNNGLVSLTLLATNSCNTASDFMVVNFSPAPIVDAGVDQSMCGTNPIVNLGGSFSGSTGAAWSTSGSGSFSPNTTDMNASYTASNADIANGSITLYLTSTGNGNCNAVIDSTIISITSGISVNAGQDQTVCSSALSTVLNGNVSNGSVTGVWTSLGTGSFVPNDSILQPQYIFSAQDTIGGSLQLVLTSTNNGSCIAESDTVVIFFGSSAYSNAGGDQIVCESSPDVNLNGFVSGGATAGVWQTSGSGVFLLSDTLLSNTYSPSATDIINGQVDLYLVTTDHGSCSQAIDTVSIQIESLPQVNAGSNILICSAVDSIQLSGSVSNAVGGVWSTNGTGYFSPNDTTLNASYVPSSSDLLLGNFIIQLTTTGNLICSESSDSISINLVDPLNINFGFSETCIGQPMSFTDSTIINNGSILSWNWDFDDGDSSSAQNPVHIYNSIGTYDVALTVESSLGCSYDLIQTVNVIDGPTAGFGISNSNVQIGEEIVIADNSSGTVTWSWNFGDGFGSSDIQNPTYNYNVSGNFLIEQIVTDALGCSDTATQELIVMDDDVNAPAIPSGFSPNGDGENDVLTVLGGPFIELELRVYNNWGNLIFESTSASNGWDGTWKGKIQPAGDYVYSVRAVTIDGNEYKKQGSVSIIR